MSPLKASGPSRSGRISPSAGQTAPTSGSPPRLKVANRIRLRLHCLVPTPLDGRPIRIDQIARGPSVQIVLTQALIDECLELVDTSGRGRHRNVFNPDRLVASRVVALIQLVTRAEFGTDRVPHQLQQFNSLFRGSSVRAEYVFITQGPHFRFEEIRRARIQIDESA